MLAVVLGLSAGVVYGVADFIGGLASRRSPLLPVLLFSQIFGTATMLIAFPFFAEGSPTADALAWGALAGVAGAGGVGFLYRGLAVGRMSVVAPLTAVNAAAIPVVFGLGTGDRPGLLALVGVGVALAAVALVSYSPEGAAERGERQGRVMLEPGFTDGLIAGVCFGLFFVLLDKAPDDSSLWPLVGARGASLTMIMAAVLVVRPKGRPRSLPLTAWAGILDVSANLLYLLATREGLLSLVAVLTSLYPASTVVLARFVLKEQLRRIQLVGLALAAVGVVLIAAG